MGSKLSSARHGCPTASLLPEEHCLCFQLAAASREPAPGELRPCPSALENTPAALPDKSFADRKRQRG